jgi:hypothetical protein
VEIMGEINEKHGGGGGGKIQDTGTCYLPKFARVIGDERTCV